MSVATHGEIVGFIWGICNLLRGPYKRNEYRKVILPLTVLRRFDCVLAATKQAVLDADARSAGQVNSVRDALLKQASGYTFYNTSRLDFRRLLDDPDNLAANLAAYIEAFSDNIREIMRCFGLAVQIERMAEKKLLFQVVSKFAGVDLSPGRVDNIQMGYIFEELIRIGAEQANEEAGEHFTPREVIRLMVSLLLSPEPDLGKEYVVKTIYDPACGTGGMLSVAEDYLREHNRDSRPLLYGQDFNDEAWAVCKSDMLLKGHEADNIILGDTFTDDGYGLRTDGRPWTFDYMLANPPFGVTWRQQERSIKNEHDTLGWDGRFGAGTPRINDGALLFLQHMLSKIASVDVASGEANRESSGSRIAIVFNGSPLFTGDAGSGESNIRRWIIESDWLEAIVALPDQLFYNTGISTYIWVLTNRKEPHRAGKVQLIDGRQFYTKMRKSLGNKRNELSKTQIDDLTRIHGNFIDGETRDLTDEDPVTHQARTRARVVSKVFASEEFGYRKITVERPLRLNFAATSERIARLEDEKAFQNLAVGSREVVCACCGWAAYGGVVSVAVVVVDPVGEASAAVGFGSELAGVEELFCDGAVEAFGFAVGLGCVGLGAPVHDGPLGQQVRELVGAEVLGVVGEDFVDGHVVGPEPRLGAPPEPDEGVGGLVVVGLDVGDSGVVVHCHVQIGVPHPPPLAFGAAGLSRAAAVHAPAAARGMRATFLMSRWTSSPGALRS